MLLDILEKETKRLGRLPLVDLHMHTTVSDGTDAPEQMPDLVAAAGIGLYAVTDHDALLGCLKIMEAGRAKRPPLITGVEFSCKDETGKSHILGYGCDPAAASVTKLIDYGHTFRMEKARARFLFLRERFGFEFSEEEIQSVLRMHNPGKPHIANLMVKCGFAKDKESAMRDYIDKKRIPSGYPRPEQAIRAILDAGGIPVLAHPSFGAGNDLIMGEELKERLALQRSFGLQGVEAYYSGFSRKIQEEVLALADQFGFYVTAGSDYHGGNKLIELGDTNLEDYTGAAPGFFRFLKDVRPAFELDEEQ